MNELVSLAVAVFKFTARYSETKMSPTPCRVGPIRTVRDKKGPPSVLLSPAGNARLRSPGSRKRKTAAVPVEVEASAGGDSSLSELTSFLGASPVDAPPVAELATDPACEALSDSSGGGCKGKLQWLFEQDTVVRQSDRRSIVEEGAAVHSHSLSCHAALQSCEGMLTPRETAGSAAPAIEHPRLDNVRHRRRVVEECLEENYRSSVEACLAQCAPLFRHARSNNECSSLEPLDGVVFHKFMVNSRGDLFDYDLKNAEAERTTNSCMQEDFPGAEYSGLTKKQKQEDDRSSTCRPSGLWLHAGRTSVQGHESSARYWKDQVKAFSEECQLLRMEREVAVLRWRQGCQELDQALDAVHTLRMTVDSLMGAKLRASSRRRSPYSTKAARGSSQVAALQGRTEKLHESSSSNDTVGLSAKVKEVEASGSTCKKLLAAKHTVTDSRTRGVGSELEQVKSGGRLDVDSISSSPSLGNTILPPCLQRTETKRYILERPPEPPTKMEGEASSEVLIEYSVESLSGQTNQRLEEIVPAAVQPLRPAAQPDSGCSTDDSRTKEQFIAAIRGIVEQVQAEDELWSQVQDILHHVSQDMENLFVACAGWEERAHQAEALSRSLGNEVAEWQVKAEVAEQQVCDLQGSMGDLLASAKHASECRSKAVEAHHEVSDMELKMRDLRFTAEQIGEWQTRAQAAEQKVLDLESELSHLRGTLEQVKGRHAIEQSRLLEAGTRLRHSVAPLRRNCTESSKSGILGQESQGMRPARASSKLIPPSGASMSGYDMGLDKGTSEHRRSSTVNREIDIVELCRYIVPQPDSENLQPPNTNSVEAKSTSLESLEQESADDGMDAGQPALPYSTRIGTGRKAIDRLSPTALASNSRGTQLDSRQMRQLRCPPRPVSSPKLTSKPKKVGLDSIISYSGPMRQCSDLDLVKGMSTQAVFDRPRNAGPSGTRNGARIPGARRVSREEGSAGLRRVDRRSAQYVGRNMGIERHDGRSWDADEDRSEFASSYSSDSDSSTIQSVEDDYSGWTLEMLDKWKENANKELNKVRGKYQPPNQQGQQRVSPGSRDSAATAWKHHISVSKTVDLRVEGSTIKAHLSAERVKAAIPTFQSLFPGKLRKKNGAKVGVHKGRNMEGDMACYDHISGHDFAGSQASETQVVERDSSVQKMRGSFFNGIQKQFLVRNSPSHVKQIGSGQATPERSFENKSGPVGTQGFERKSLRDKKSEGSFLEDLRRHFTGKSPSHPGKDRPRAISPFPSDHQMHYGIASPVVSTRQPLTEIIGNASEFLGNRVFYSG